MKEFFKGVMHMTIEEMKEKKREHGYTYNMMSQMSGVPLGTVQKILRVRRNRRAMIRLRHWHVSLKWRP